LDDDKGGYFKVSPTVAGVSYKQIYWPESNVLVTRCLSHNGVAEVIDFMPVGSNQPRHSHSELVLRVNAVRGSMPFRMECISAFNYARDNHQVQLNTSGAALFSQNLSLQLSSTAELQKPKSGIISNLVLNEGQILTFALGEIYPECSNYHGFTEKESEKLFEETVAYWRRWLSQSTYRGRWREMVEQSALALKLLTYKPTGAIVASPTCSLPEELSGVRNWDYRYTWIRDAALTLYGLLRIGFTEEAAKIMGWIEARASELDPDGSLQIMFGINGGHDLTGVSLSKLSGLKGSSPVRISNNAFGQLKLDIYGELIDAVYLYNNYGSPISCDFWSHPRRMTNWVCDN
jgi:GH15 family glucan-1,4-alpha-glucosidase